MQINIKATKDTCGIMEIVMKAKGELEDKTRLGSKLIVRTANL